MNGYKKGGKSFRKVDISMEGVEWDEKKKLK